MHVFEIFLVTRQRSLRRARTGDRIWTEVPAFEDSDVDRPSDPLTLGLVGLGSTFV